MGLREEFQKRIDKKQQEIVELQLLIREAAAYVQALQDSMRLLPKDFNSNHPKPEQTLRSGTSIAKAHDAIQKAGKPLHIAELLKAIGLTPDKKQRVSLSGSLAAYVRRHEIFTRPAPNTFGLVALGHTSGVPNDPEPPEGFGAQQAGDDDVPELPDDDIPF
jgi:hypothetical protein